MAIITSKTFNGIQLLKVNSNPSGISAPNGSIALDTSTANKYRNVGGDVWNLIVSGSITEPQTNGTQGPQGNQGPQGSTGDRGAQGVPGTQGSQGPTGDRGTQGVPGTQGSNGDRGTQGVPGTQGSNGDRGTQGTPGTQGPQGSTGDRGTQGVPGTQGPQGPQGSIGVGTQGPQGVPGSGGGGASGGLPVINVTTDLVRLGYSANAKNDGTTGGGDAIQDAIDHFLLNPEDFYAIYIPPGVYSISKSLIIAYPPLGNAAAGTWSQCNIISSLNMFPDVGGAKIKWNSGLGKVDPMLVIQGARNVSLSGITFDGPNAAPFDLLDAPNHYEALFTSEYADWLSYGIRDNSRSPQCCVAIDPFVNGNPGGSSANRYPNLTDYYVEKYQRSSSNIVFEHCGFRKSNFGVVISPSGPVGGVDVIGNSENFYFKNCFFEYNRIHYSTGQSQARANNLFSPRMIGSWIAIDTELVGPDGNQGVAPILSGAPNFGGCKYVFNINTRNQVFDASSCYFESIASLGRIDFGAGGLGARFSSCSITFIAPGDVGTDTAASAAVGGTVAGIPYHLSNMGMLHMDRCGINTGDYPLKIWNDSSARLKLTQCAIQTPGSNSKIQVGFDKYSLRNDQKIVTIDNIIVVPVTGNIIQDSPTTTKWNSYDIGGATFTQGANPTIGTFTVTSGQAENLEVGDLIYLESGPGNDFQPEIFTTNGYSAADLWGTIGKIQSVTDSGATRTVTVKHIHKGFPFDTAVNIRRFRWSA